MTALIADEALMTAAGYYFPADGLPVISGTILLGVALATAAATAPIPKPAPSPIPAPDPVPA